MSDGATAQPIRVTVLTISDSAWQRTREDLSGPALREALERLTFKVSHVEVIPDEVAMVRDRLEAIIQETGPDIILTTGGTGLSPRDQTPEATRAVIERQVPGISELMRLEGMKSTPRAMLSRGIAGVRGKTLIVNLPGSVKGALESLRAIEEILPHAVELVRGNPVRCGEPQINANRR